MSKNRHQAEQIIPKLRAIEVNLSKGMSAKEASRQEGISEATYYLWRKKFGGLRMDQAMRSKDTWTSTVYALASAP